MLHLKQKAQKLLDRIIPVLFLGPIMGLSSFGGSPEDGLLQLSPYKERGDIWELEHKSNSSYSKNKKHHKLVHKKHNI